MQHPPYDFRCDLEAKRDKKNRSNMQVSIHHLAPRDTRYLSMAGPNECGMNRGHWKSIVEAILWYTQSAIASARLPGMNSSMKKNTYFVRSMFMMMMMMMDSTHREARNTITKRRMLLEPTLHTAIIETC